MCHPLQMALSGLSAAMDKLGLRRAVTRLAAQQRRRVAEIGDVEVSSRCSWQYDRAAHNQSRICFYWLSGCSPAAGTHAALWTRAGPSAHPGGSPRLKEHEQDASEQRHEVAGLIATALPSLPRVDPDQQAVTQSNVANARPRSAVPASYPHPPVPSEVGASLGGWTRWRL
jgi:hypothetical protein